MKQKDIFITRVEEMFHYLSFGRKEVQPSKFWIKINKLHMDELSRNGFDNFKQTVARKYFANTPLFFMNKQVLFLILNSSLPTTIKNLIKSFIIPKHSYFSRIDSASYNFLTLMIWDYVKSNDHDKLLLLMEEPLVGNPPVIYDDKRLVSQDLANSVLEYKSIIDGIRKGSDIKTVCELGAGSGRNAFVFLSLIPNIKYIIIDIPPALAISERYLSQIFPGKKIFRFRPFKSFSEIRKDFESANILFFLSSQIEKLPKGIADLFINISSLHEMRMDQVRFYFKQIERLTKKGGYFYFKQWKNAYVDYEDIYIQMEDYPITDVWEKIYMREVKIQTKFFEALVRRK